MRAKHVEQPFAIARFLQMNFEWYHFKAFPYDAVRYLIYSVCVGLVYKTFQPLHQFIGNLSRFGCLQHCHADPLLDDLVCVLRRLTECTR